MESVKDCAKRVSGFEFAFGPVDEALDILTMSEDNHPAEKDAGQKYWNVMFYEVIEDWDGNRSADRSEGHISSTPEDQAEESQAEGYSQGGQRQKNAATCRDSLAALEPM